MLVSNKFFDIRATLECGQVFRFKRIDGGYELISGDKRCSIYESKDDSFSKIITNHEEYFFDYFDLSRDYDKVCQNLTAFDELRPLEGCCKGIHILRQDLFETIISFIISANNNIKRIKSIIERLCTKFGEKRDGFFAFPTPKSLFDRTEKDFDDLGAGYRATYIHKTIKTLCETDLLERLKTMSYEESVAALTTLSGVGRKVADCIALFALSHTRCYPVDTNIFKADSKLQKNSANIKRVRDEGVLRYGEFAGFAQQWKFFHRIDNGGL